MGVGNVNRQQPQPNQPPVQPLQLPIQPLQLPVQPLQLQHPQQRNNRALRFIMQLQEQELVTEFTPIPVQDRVYNSVPILDLTLNPIFNNRMRLAAAKAAAKATVANAIVKAIANMQN